MITYAKSYFGLHLLYRFYGSAFLRCLPFAILSGAETALLYVYWNQGDKSAWRHPYPYALSAFIVGFVIVYRSNYGYQRYWEGRTMIQDMTGRWTDAYIQAVVNHTAGGSLTSERCVEFRDTLLHLMSLMHGLAIQHLRGDWDLNNLQPTHSTDLPPPGDAAALQYIFGPSKRKQGTWRFDPVDLFILHGTEEKRAKYNRAMPLRVIGGVSHEESQMLGIDIAMYEESSMKTAVYGQEIQPSSFMSKLFGLSTGMYIPGAAERVQQVYSWVLQLLKQSYMEEDHCMPPPILANCYRMLSEGLIAFENARKICDTPFPFPWAQAVLLLLVLYAFTLPLLVVAFINQLWLAIVIDIIAVQSYFALNEVARDLEDPFVYEPNDLPMARIQFQFNERIKAGSSTLRPLYFNQGNALMADRSHCIAQRSSKGDEYREYRDCTFRARQSESNNNYNYKGHSRKTMLPGEDQQEENYRSPTAGPPVAIRSHSTKAAADFFDGHPSSNLTSFDFPRRIPSHISTPGYCVRGPQDLKPESCIVDMTNRRHSWANGER